MPPFTHLPRKRAQASADAVPPSTALNHRGPLEDAKLTMRCRLGQSCPSRQLADSDDSVAVAVAEKR
jgi:hypothetical protein